MSSNSKCSGCSAPNDGISHKCDICGNRNHVFCGIPFGEGHGSSVRCRSCNNESLTLSAGTLDAFLSMPASGEEDTVLPSDGDDVVEIEIGSAVASTPMPTKGVRQPQNVTRLTDKVRVVKWMIDMHAKGEQKLPSATIKAFRSIFRGVYYNNVQKARRWWCQRESILASKLNSIVHRQPGRQARRLYPKAAPGRGPKRAAWVNWLHCTLRDEFVHMR